MPDRGITRRRFLGATVLGAGALAIVPRHVLGGPAFSPPSEVLTRATIGTGAQGMTHVVENREGAPAVQLAACDVDKNHLTQLPQWGRLKKILCAFSESWPALAGAPQGLAAWRRDENSV
jgi:hypothetical protein